MSERDRLLEKTRTAVERQAGERAAAAARDAEPPAPGDLFVLKRSADTPVEWAVLARDPEATRRVLAVPADGGSLAGSADVEIPASAAGGPLTLRCRFTRWLDAELFEARRRIGVLDPGDVARARRRWSEIESGVLTGSVLEREVDEDSEYQDWIDEVVAPAGRDVAAAAPGPAEPAPAGSRLSHRFRPGALMAASILLLVATALVGSQLWRQQRRIETLVAAGELAGREHRREVERLAAERDRAAAALAELEEKAGETSARAEGELRQRISELERRLFELRRKATVVNPVIALLEAPGDLRGEAESLRLPPQASHAILLLPLGESPSASDYRIELTEMGSGKQVWSVDGLRPEEPGEIRVGLPASLLAPGDYRLRLIALEEGRPRRRVAEHLLRVERD